MLASSRYVNFASKPTVRLLQLRMHCVSPELTPRASREAGCNTTGWPAAAMSEPLYMSKLARYTEGLAGPVHKLCMPKVTALAPVKVAMRAVAFTPSWRERLGVTLNTTSLVFAGDRVALR